MSNLSLLVVLVVGALCVEGLNYKSILNAAGKTKRDMKEVRDVLKEELENWRQQEMERDELLEMREASGEDSDDTDESGEEDESPEGERAEIRFSVNCFNNIYTENNKRHHTYLGFALDLIKTK